MICYDFDLNVFILHIAHFEKHHFVQCIFTSSMDNQFCGLLKFYVFLSFLGLTLIIRQDVWPDFCGHHFWPLWQLRQDKASDEHLPEQWGHQLLLALCGAGRRQFPSHHTTATLFSSNANHTIQPPHYSVPMPITPYNRHTIQFQCQVHHNAT